MLFSKNALILSLWPALYVAGRLICSRGAAMLPSSSSYQEEIKIPSGPDARRSVGGEIGAACLRIGLLKFALRVWSPDVGLCANISKGEDTGEEWERRPPTYAYHRFGPGGHRVWNLTVVTIHQNQTSQGSRLKAERVKHQLDKYVAALRCKQSMWCRISDHRTDYFLKPKE